MARIRTIKPEFFTSEDIVSVSPLARLFYVSLWCEADREGRLEWKPGTFKMRYLPGDNCDVSALSEELTERGLLMLYEVDGRRLAHIPTFKKHQVINNRESESDLPAPPSDASCTRASRVKAEGKEGRERKGKEGREGEDTPARKRADAFPCPEDVNCQVWEDWLSLRKSKRAPVTATVVSEARSEAAKAGMTLTAYLRVWCARGSQGLQADWLRPHERGSPKAAELSKWVKGTSLDPEFRGYDDGVIDAAPALR